MNIPVVFNNGADTKKREKKSLSLFVLFLFTREISKHFRQIPHPLFFKT